MIAHHHDRNYIAAVNADRRPAGDPRELEGLLRAAARGEDAAWHSLVRRFGQRLRRLAGSHRLGADDVEDVVQSTFIRLYENLDTLREPNALPAWLETTARRESLRRIRVAGRECYLEPGVAESVPAPPDEEERVDDDLRAELKGAVERLPVRQRQVMQLLHAEPQPSYQEISQALGMPIGSIGPTRARALRRLRSEGRLVAAVDATREAA